MKITDLIEKLENIQNMIDDDADPNVFLDVGGQEVALTDITYYAETPFNYECIVLS